jgi:TolB-like protein/DNA-binding winged helix-turn-helix (wHTH) protein
LYRFGDYELDDQLYELRRADAVVELERKVYDVLVYLVQHRERLVTKDELLDKLWPGQVVGEAALTRCITSARKVLGDDGNRQEFIKTQHGRGYRFVAPLTIAAPSVSSSEFPAPSQEEAVSSQHPVVNRQQEENQKAKLEDSEQETEESYRLDEAPRNPGEEPKSEPWIPLRSLRAVHLAGAALLMAGIVFSVRYFSRPVLVTPHSALFTEEIQPSLPLPDKPSIIVLPFVNLSGDPGQEHFSDGVTEEITAALSRLSSLFVIARTSAFTYKDKAATVQDISREMGVRYVLEGSARKADGQLRIIARLIDATTGAHLWSEYYDRPLTEVFTAQDEIVQKIAFALKVKLTQEEQARFTRAPTNNLEAYDYYLRGWKAWFRTTKETNAQARQMFEKAIELDPHYAAAYAGLSMTYWMEWLAQWSADPQNVKRAAELAQQAIVLDNALPGPHSILGMIKLFQKQYEQASVEMERAVTLDPNNAGGYDTLTYLLYAVGRTEEAIEAARKAVRLDPHQFLYFNALGWAYLTAGQYEEAMAAFKRVLIYHSNLWTAHQGLAISYSESGREEEANAEVAEMLRIIPQYTVEVWRRTATWKDPAIIERWAAALRKAGLK